MPGARLVVGLHQWGPLPDSVPTSILDVRGGRAGDLKTAKFKATRRSHWMSRRFKSFDPDVVVAHSLIDAWRISRESRRAGVPLACVVHGSDLLETNPSRPTFSQRSVRTNWAELVRCVDHFLPVSTFLADELMRRGVARSKVTPHYLGVTVPDRAEVLPAPADSRSMLFLGRLSANKGPCEAVRVLGELPRPVGACLTVVGGGPEAEGVERVVRSLRLADSVRLLGPLRHGDARRHFLPTVVLVAPSVTSRSGASEGLGLAPLEAQAFGRPAVVYATGGLPETVVDGVTGFVVPTGDRTAMRDRVLELLLDHDVAREMGAEGRRRVERQFDLRVQTSRLMSVLEGVADGGVSS